PELMCGLAIGLEQPLCSFGVRGAALEPASHERIDQRCKSQSRRRQHKPRVQVGSSLEVVLGVHLALLPIRRRDSPAPRVTLLLFGSAQLWAEHSDPASSRTCTTNRPAEEAA